MWKRLDDKVLLKYTLGTMKKLLTMCLLIIGLYVIGCGEVERVNFRNTPVIYSVTPSDSSSMANCVDSKGNLTVTLTGVNLGSDNGTNRVYYYGYSSLNSGDPQITALEFVNGGTWTDSKVSVLIYPDTRARFPYGSFSIVVNGEESPQTSVYNFGNLDLSGAVIKSVSPSEIYSYEDSRTVTIAGSGFGNYSSRQDLVLYTTSGYSATIKKEDVIYWSDTQIILPLPIDDMINKINSSVMCYVRTNDSINNSILASFSFNVPQIYWAEPNTGAIGRIINIHGKNLGNSNRDLSVSCDGKYANIASWSDDCIKVQIPAMETTGPKAIQLKRNNKNVGSGLSYEVKAPLLYSCSKSYDLKEGDRVTLNGICFGNASELKGIYAYNGRVEISDTESGSSNNAIIYMNDPSVDWQDNSISFVWPRLKSNTFSDKTFNIKVFVGNSETFFSNVISVTD